MGISFSKPSQGKIYIAPNTGDGIAPQRQANPVVDTSSYRLSPLGVPMMTPEQEAEDRRMEAFNNKMKANKQKQAKAERTAAGAVVSKAEPVKMTSKPYKAPAMFGALDALKLKASKAAAVAKTTPIAAPTVRDTMAEQRPVYTTRPIKVLPPEYYKARDALAGIVK